MFTAAVIASLIAAQPALAGGPGTTVITPTPNAVPSGTSGEAFSTAAPEFSVSNAALPVGFIALLGLGALYARRRRTRTGRLIQVLEVANIGPKRSLILARLGNQTLLLGASESGLQTLSCQPLSEEMLAVADAQAARDNGNRRGTEGTDSKKTPPFESLLGEVTEDQELRRKLALGLAGKIQ